MFNYYPRLNRRYMSNSQRSINKNKADRYIRIVSNLCKRIERRARNECKEPNCIHYLATISKIEKEIAEFCLNELKKRDPYFSISLFQDAFKSNKIKKSKNKNFVSVVKKKELIEEEQLELPL